MAKGEPVKVHELGPYLKKKKYIHREGYQCTQFSTCIINYRVPGPELTVKPVETMVQDSGKKKKIREKKRQYISKRKADSHTKKLEAVLKHQKKKKKQRGKQC